MGLYHITKFCVKIYDLWNEWGYIILLDSVWRFMICGNFPPHTKWVQALAIAILSFTHSPDVRLIDNWHIMHNYQVWTFFWHLTSCLNHLSPLQCYFQWFATQCVWWDEWDVGVTHVHVHTHAKYMLKIHVKKLQMVVMGASICNWGLDTMR